MFLSISFIFKSKNCQDAVNHLFHNFITITSIVKLNQTMIASLWVVHFTYLNFNKKCFYFHFLATEWLFFNKMFSLIFYKIIVIRRVTLPSFTAIYSTEDFLCFDRLLWWPAVASYEHSKGIHLIKSTISAILQLLHISICSQFTWLILEQKHSFVD